MTYYDDVDRGFLVGQTQSLAREGDCYDIETTFENDRKFDGVTHPCKIAQVMADIPGIGEGRQTWVFDKTLHNVRIDPTKFERPTELADDE